MQGSAGDVTPPRISGLPEAWYSTMASAMSTPVSSPTPWNPDVIMVNVEDQTASNQGSSSSSLVAARERVVTEGGVEARERLVF